MVRTDTEETQAVDVLECETPEPSRVGSTDSLLSTPLDVKCLRNQYQHPGGSMPSTLELGASEAPLPDPNMGGGAALESPVVDSTLEEAEACLVS